MKKWIVCLAVSLTLVACSSATNQSVSENSASSAETESATDTAVKAAPEADKPAAEKAEVKAEAQPQDADISKLLDPAALNETAPAEFVVLVKTTKGDMRFKIDRSWAPNGVDRFYNLVKNGYYSDIAMFRMVPGFVVQFGIHGKPVLNDVWRDANIQDDPENKSNVDGTLTFANAGPNTRTTQMFINVGNNTMLDKRGFPPIGKIIEGRDVLDKLNFEYGEKPNQGMIHKKGNTYLKASFPNLDYIISMTVE
ncbi:MAG: peptidylprolyl isomerase [Proteobacteria bacterium]|nr:peptidylprolyl isomerase [Pseudomonadota bacterium]